MEISKLPGSSGGGRNTNTCKPPVILVPDIEDLKQIDKSSVDVFREVLEAGNLANQVDKIRSLVRSISKDRFQISAIVFIQWYFNCDPKSGIRKVISNCLNSVKDEEFGALIKEQVSVYIRKECVEQDKKSVDVVKKILFAFENFPLGEAGIQNEAETVINYLTSEMEKQIEIVCEDDISPVDKAVHTEEAGNSIRALVHLLKCCSDKIGHLQEKIVSLSYRILCLNELPLDLRSNCGHIYVLIQANKDRSKIAKYIKDIESKGCTEDSLFTMSNPGTVLSLLHGLMSCYSMTDLIKAQLQDNTLGVILSTYLRISKDTRDTQCILWYTRGLLSWSFKFVEFCKSEESAAFITSYQKDLNEFIWIHLDHSMDSVKHNCRSFFDNLICGLMSGKETSILDKLLVETINLPIYSKARLAALSCMVRSYSVDKVVELYPSIQSDILSLSSEYALVGQIVDLYENIMKKLFKEKEDSKLWFELNIKPLVKLYCIEETQGVTQLVTSLLKKAMKLDIRVIDEILNEHRPSSKLAICCLKISRESGQQWNFLKHMNMLKDSLNDFSEEIRLQAFSLCVESHSTVEPFIAEELDTLCNFIIAHLTLQSPSLQQTFLALVKKMLKRIYEGSSALAKKLTQKKFMNEFKLMEATIDYYNILLKKLLMKIFANLFPGANNSRRTTALEILSFIASTFGFTQVGKIDLTGIATDSTANSLLCCLYDTFESNKEKALSVLKTLPPSILSLHSPDRVSDMLDDCVKLMMSNKPPDSITASFYIKLLLSAPALPWVLADRLSLIKSNPETVKFMMAVFIRNTLVEQLAFAENSLLDAAVDGPMYGTIACLKTVYDQLSPTEFCEEWEHLTKDIISVCFNVWRVVGGVVASDSPEGHLPMDLDREGRARMKKVMKHSLGNKTSKISNTNNNFDLYCAVFNQVVVSDIFPVEIAEEIVDDLVDKVVGSEGNDDNVCQDLFDLSSEMSTISVSDEIITSPEDEISESGLSKAREVSSQMLLLCAWRSVKEISLFLGDLCKNFTATGPNIVTSEQIIDISSFLMDLLSDTKHRGAFEQAYVAFARLCSSMWQSSHSELHSHPARLLNEILLNINEGKKGNKTTLCSTRRSAGVPFIVQAVLSTEVDSSGALFKSTMTKLLKLAESKTSDLETKVHCLNILRALYRDSKLGELVTTFVEQGVKVAILGFKSPVWAERNASTLLFSALMTRIFGVKREKDSMSSKNCLTGKVFFQRYPCLHQFFVDQLSEYQSASTTDGILNLDTALYPILLMLSRIFPSPTEMMNNPYPLSAFFSYVDKCTGSSIYQTRILASSALIPLLSYDGVDDYVKRILCRVADSKLTQNVLHGILLQLKECLVKFPCTDEVIMSRIFTIPIIDKLLKENPCSLTSATYMELVNRASIRNQESDIILYLQSILVEKLFDEKESSNAEPSLSLPSDVWKPLLFKHSANFIVRTSLANEQISYVVKLLVHPEYEVRSEVIQLVTDHIMSDANPEIPCQELMSLLFCEKHPLCLEKLLICCSHLSEEQLLGDQIPFLLSLIESTDNDDVKAAGIRLSSKMLTSSDANSKLSWALMIRDAIDSDNDLEVRDAATAALVKNHTLLEVPKSDQILERKACIVSWLAVTRMILDNESCIRNQTSCLYEKFSCKKVSSSSAGLNLMKIMMNTLGKNWPAAGLTVCISSVLSLLFDQGENDETFTEVDKAFDKNEMNNFQEIIGLALLLLPLVGALVRKFSPKVQEKAFSQNLPEDLMASILPDLPGAVSVYNMKQLLEYLTERARSEISELEILLMVLIFDNMRCSSTEEIFVKFVSILGDKFAEMKSKTYFVESLEQICSTRPKHG